ncbi:MAG: hypothetical protein EAZ91_24495 [Cytophagales bacterium]|nr:MAG: hypothetical protein EAZ91_24495 [Cytophagales bacterium]
MTPTLPLYLPVSFGLITCITLGFVYWILRQSNATGTRQRTLAITLALFGWLLVQAVLPLAGLYEPDPMVAPPRIIVLGILPAVFAILFLMITPVGRRFTTSLSLVAMTYLSVVRVAVELVLYGLFTEKLVPELMTFEGRNFDILAGLTAPIVAYLFATGRLSRRELLVWNVVCLGLLINIVVNALLSAPTPFQQFAFEQPNLAIAYFPFSWLPTFVVPVVMLCHLVSIRQLAGRAVVKQPLRV